MRAQSPWTGLRHWGGVCIRLKTSVRGSCNRHTARWIDDPNLCEPGSQTPAAEPGGKCGCREPDRKKGVWVPKGKPILCYFGSP